MIRAHFWRWRYRRSAGWPPFFEEPERRRARWITSPPCRSQSVTRTRLTKVPLALRSIEEGRVVAVVHEDHVAARDALVLKAQVGREATARHGSTASVRRHEPGDLAVLYEPGCSGPARGPRRRPGCRGARRAVELEFLRRPWALVGVVDAALDMVVTQWVGPRGCSKDPYGRRRDVCARTVLRHFFRIDVLVDITAQLGWGHAETTLTPTAMTWGWRSWWAFSVPFAVEEGSSRRTLPYRGEAALAHPGWAPADSARSIIEHATGSARARRATTAGRCSARRHRRATGARLRDRARTWSRDSRAALFRRFDDVHPQDQAVAGTCTRA